MKIKHLNNCLFALLFSFVSLSLSAQQKTIAGKILDQDSHQPMAGVTVSVKGGRTVAVSDNTGAFTIAVPSDQPVLETTFVGYSTQDHLYPIQ